MRSRVPLRASILVAGLAAATAGCSPISQPNVVPKSNEDNRLEFTGYVVDQANVLRPDERSALTEQLGEFQRSTKHQLAVVTVKSLKGREIAEFTNALANRWGVGRKDVNDGIVVLVAPNDRKARISVGRGLKSRLPNAFCQGVMSNVMVPQFAKGHFGLGVKAGVTAIIQRLAKSETNGS